MKKTMQIYLFLNAFLYLSFAIWCIVKFVGTSGFLGYSFLNNSGKVEYLTIYTGLQMGFAIFLAICAYYPSLRLAGLLFCVAAYVCIVITRTLSGSYFGDLEKASFMIGALEYSLCIWGLILLFRNWDLVKNLEA
ncbi:hypothetical protein CNR22_04390 [Sphingobacteriaceae bacterium]|nr:hypothetical protein CNR22_04390 [Sphingobacteriaceae bacterium]